MNLNDFKKYKKIILQCHDNPDADAIASGFALYTYFTEMGIDASIVYSGKFQIQKSNLKLMIDKLDIPIEYKTIEEFIVGEEEVLITVDCQYGAGNVTSPVVKNVAIIDHHQVEIENVENSLIISNSNSCSTIIWQLLSEEDFDFNNHPNVSTALYYGLYTDTLQFSEIYNPTDKDMRDSLYFNRSTINQLRNCNLSAQELEIAGLAIVRSIYNEQFRFSVIKSKPCDPNILGLISDMCIQVDNVDMCVVYNEINDGIKFSIRSCIRETKACDLAVFLAENIGSGGGHLEKAGGYIRHGRFKEKYPSETTETYFANRIVEYCSSYETIEARDYEVDLSTMKKYRKLNIPVGYVVPDEFLPIGTPITIRTLEGDIDTVVSGDICIIIGIQGEVYPNTKEKFQRCYTQSEEPYHLKAAYKPTIKSRIDGANIPLAGHVRSCVTSGKTYIYAKPLEHTVKVFTAWDGDKYMLGKPGDMLAVRSDDMHDIYIINGEIFKITYEESE